MKSSLFGVLLLIAAAGGNASQEPTIDAKASSHHLPPGKPIELQLKHAGSKKFDLRRLPHTKPKQQERPEFEEPELNPVELPGGPQPAAALSAPGPSAPAPAPNNVFEGLDRFTWGAGSPPDTNGDVGPTHYIQTVNTSIGVFRKSDGFQEAAFTFNTFMSQGNFGNLCDTNNFGDPVVLYDTFEDRWVITDFAFLTDISGNVLAPAFQCFAVSMSGDPISGGWNFYSRQISDNLDDYPKFGIWPDGLYMSANMFSFGAGSAFKGARAWAFNKAQMYAGSPTVQVVQFDIGGGDFTVIPSNARLQTGTPPAGRPNLFVSTWLFTNALTVYKFHVDWNSISLSTFTGPDTPLAATSWPNAAVANAPQPGTATLLDVLQIRAMVQNQYTNFGGVESLWPTHTVRRANTTGFAAPRWYQVDVTGGTVAANLPQAATWDPDGANTNHRFMPSVALDRAGDMAMGYSVSNATTVFPSMRYAGRLAADPVNTFSQTEQTFFTGTASQTGSTRWGDYSSMTLDPDGCTFWYANEYANPADQTFNHRWLTKLGSFGPFPGCTPVGAGGDISGTVTVNPGGAPISGATVQLGARSTTTDGSGNYTFAGIPAGTYPTLDASQPGFVSASASSIVVTDGGTTIQNFSLTAAPASACLTDTTQSDFLEGVSSATLDLNTSPGDALLSNAPASDQANTAGTTTGTGFGTPNWTGMTFISAVSGTLAKADIQLFCSGCGATPPNLTLSVRNTSAGLPTGADLASTTVPGSAFASGGITLYTASFGSPATLASGTQYALILRPVSVPAGSGYFWIRSSPSTYASGSRVLSADSGGTWSADTTRDYNFRTYMQTGYAASGNLISAPKDSNPAGGLTPIWSTLSWNATTPANTSVQFQVAGSNNVGGPFNFVGPDGTAATFFTTSPVQLSPQFYNLRYLEYKAYLATTDGTVTPVLSDATICFNDVDCSTTSASIIPTPAQVCSNSTGNNASGPAGMTAYAWGIANGTITSATNTQSMTYTAGASGTLDLDLSVTAPNACIASNSVPVTIDQPEPTPTVTPGGPTTFCAGGSVLLTSSSASGNQWFLNANPIGGETNQSYSATASGNYSVGVTTNSCPSSTSTDTTVTVNPLPATPTITPGGPTTFCAGGSVTLTSSSASGNQWYLNGNPIGGETNQTYVATASGDYTVGVTDGNSCSSAASAVTTITVNPIPATPTITPGGPTTFCAGGSVTLTSSSASGNQWFLSSNPIGGATNSSYIATASGNYAVSVTTNSCSSAASSDEAVTVNPIPAMPTITPSGPTTFYVGDSVTLTSSSGSGNQWFLNGNPIGGATNSTYVASAAGNYSVAVTTSGCTSTTSATTTVTVNPYPTTTSVISSQNPSVFGQSVTFTASVTPNPTPGPATPTGSVTFFDGASPLGSAVSLNGSAQATLTTSSLSGGSHSITVSYPGDATFQNSTSSPLTQTVDISTVGGSISGLSGSGLVLRLTYGDASTTADLPVSSGATSFTFNSTNVALGDAYSVSVLTPPTSPSQTCTVSNASGTMPATDVTTVVVACSTTLYNVGVSVSGLTGPGLALQLNGDSTLSAPTNSTFNFASKLPSGSSYIVSVNAQPAGQLCSVTSPTGTVTSADVVVPVTCIAATSSLNLTVDDGHLYARYGQVLDYIVTLSNSGNATATDVSVSSTPSAGLDAANANWSCLGAGAGATCTASGSGAFADTATVPPNRTLTWLVSTPVFGNASDPDVTLSVAATGASSVSDTDTLVIFRDGFNIPYADGTAALILSPNGAGALSGGASEVFALPAAHGNGIIDVLVLRSGNAEAHVQSVTLGDATLVRVLTRMGNAESVSAWAHAHIGATLAIGSVAASDGQRLILLEGAERSLAVPAAAN